MIGCFIGSEDTLTALPTISPLAQKLLPNLPTHDKRWWLAVSGGLDSMCLLSLISELKQHQLPPISHSPLPAISVIHVNHGLQADADAWQALVQKTALTAGFEFIAHKIELDPQQQANTGLESAARIARYDTFAAHIKAEEVLLFAHHGDDQAETLLLRLLRGAGIAGLGGIPTHRPLQLNTASVATNAELYRPLLGCTRQELEDYAKQQQLLWVEDPSNQDDTFDRNFLRQKVMPVLKQRWPNVVKRAQVTSQLAQESQILLDDLASIDFAAMQVVSKASFPSHLDLAQLSTLSSPRRANVLRWWLHQLLAVTPTQQQLKQIDQQFITAAEDAQPCITIGNGHLRRFGKQLYWQSIAQQPSPWQPITLHWPPAQIQDIDLFKLIVNTEINTDPNVAKDAQAQCINHTSTASFDKWAIPVANGVLMPKLGGLKIESGDLLEVCYRQGGQRCRPMGRTHSQTLKKLLQEYKIPTVERQHVPLFFVNGELAMVGRYWVCHGFAADEQQVGWHWQAS